MYTGTYQSIYSHIPSRERRQFTNNHRLGRFVLILLIIGIVVTFGAIVHVNASQTDFSAGDSSVLIIEVQQGETLWGIAKNYAPSGTDVRDYIFQIRKANHLTSTTLYVGMELILP